MPRGFLVKRSSRPMPISYRMRCSCYPAAGLEGGDPVQLLILPPFPAPHFPSAASASESAEAALLPAPVVPQFGMPEGPSSPALLHSPAPSRCRNRYSWALEETSSFGQLPPPPSLLARCLPLSAAMGGASKQSQGRKAKAARKFHFEDEETAKGGGGGGGNSSSSSERDTPSPGNGGDGSRGEPEAAGAEEFTCPRCAKRFRCQSTLRKHLPLHHKPLDGLSQARPLPEACLEEAASDGHSPLSLSGECHLCPVCGETFPSKSGQERHLRVLHAAQAFPCKYCLTTFYSSPGLTCHINKCHPSENRQVILLQVPVRV
ncbi:insulinoma-associated protein 1 [Crotalus adamanteus]|uniref:Insulinoma-associated protein 1 n=1 Tax=Crotalus adamanteus TaxID=8729 RepID=A0AAW1B5P1_CROAD